MKNVPLPSSANARKNELTRIRRFGQITLPTDVRKHLGFREGDYLELSVVTNGILLRSVKVVLKKSPKKRPAMVGQKKERK